MFIKYHECVKLMKSRPSGVLHIGAHRGQEGVDYSKNGVKKVIWVEANPDWIKDLKERTSPLDMEQVYLCNVISDEDGVEVDFNVSNNQQSSSILELGTHATLYPKIKYVEKKRMTARTFKSLVAEHNFNMQEYQFLNVDVQGAELKVLKGLEEFLAGFDALYLEVNNEEVYKGCALTKDIDEYVAGFGFKRIREKFEKGKWGDALYLR